MWCGARPSRWPWTFSEPRLHGCRKTVGVAETHPALRAGKNVRAADLPAEQVIVTVDQRTDQQGDVLPVTQALGRRRGSHSQMDHGLSPSMVSPNRANSSQKLTSSGAGLPQLQPRYGLGFAPGSAPDADGQRNPAKEETHAAQGCDGAQPGDA